MKRNITSAFIWAIFFCNSAAYAQSIRLIPNLTTNFGDAENPVPPLNVYKNKLYFTYHRSAGVLHYGNESFAYCADTVINLIPAQPNFYLEEAILFRDKILGFSSTSQTGVSKLYDTSYNAFNNPDSGAGFQGNAIIYNNDLYFDYEDTNYISHLAKFDGSKISLFKNPTQIASGLGIDLFTNPIVYKGNLYYSYTDSGYINKVAKFDGTNVILLTNPDAGEGIYESTPIIFDDKLYFNYINEIGTNQLAKCDGNTLSVVNNVNETDAGFIGSPVIYNNDLYFYYLGEGGTQLAKYKGSGGIILISNLTADDAGFGGVPTIYNNEIIAPYLGGSDKIKLAAFNGTKISLIDNPEPNGEINGGSDGGLVYGSKFYHSYINEQGNYQLAEYDGIKTSLINNPDSGSGVQGFAVLNDNKVYFMYKNEAYEQQIAYLTLPIYYFTGAGNYSNAFNWSNGVVPPETLPSGSEIVINPSIGGECVLDRIQHVSKGAKFTIQSGKLRILTDLILE